MSKNLRLLILGAVLLGLALGFSIRPSGIHGDQPPGVTDGWSERPAAEPLVASQSAQKLSAGPWREGWQFARRTVCISSNVPGAPLSAVASMYQGVGGLKIVNAGTAACWRRGFTAAQTVSFQLYTASDRKTYKGYCAYTQPLNYGDLSGAYIRINPNGINRTACGSGSEWVEVFAHEFGHAVGLSHDQPKVSSIMRDGHGLDASDRSKLATIYSKRKA